jgi:uncharacterized membrane protein YfcA
MLTLIGIVLFFLSELVYDQFHSPKQTNWLIFYYSLHYLAITFVCFDQSLFNYKKWMRWLFTIFGILSFCYFVIELSFINVPLETYFNGITNRIVSNLTLVIITFTTGLISYGLWHKHLKTFLGRLLDRF